MKQLLWLSACVAFCLVLPALAQAQPSRQMPGTRPHLPGSPPPGFPEANSRTRAANSGVGLESTDFYGKKGYPRVLGDSVEASATGSTGTSGGISGGGVAGGNTGALGGGAAGAGGALGGGGGALGNLGFRNGFGGGTPTQTGITGGGFSGLVPKGFGFGGSSSFEHSWLSPLRGYAE